MGDVMYSMVTIVNNIVFIFESWQENIGRYFCQMIILSAGKGKVKWFSSLHFIDVGGVSNFLGSVSSQQKFEVTDGPVLQLCVTAQFYLDTNLVT